VAQRDGDGERARPVPRRDAIEIADKLREQIVGIQLRDDRFQERAGPREPRRVRCELSQRTRTQLRPPPLSIELLLGSNGVLEQTVDVGDQVTDLAHDGTLRRDN
jgi:hypothetical protein